MMNFYAGFLTGVVTVLLAFGCTLLAIAVSSMRAGRRAQAGRPSAGTIPQPQRGES